MYFTLIPIFEGVLLATAARASSIPMGNTAAWSACTSLEALAKTSNLIFSNPGSTQYALDIEHFSPSATQNATCSVAPSTPAEVASVLKLINQTRTPWAVKGHGHIYNQGFSSTTGVQISLRRFNQTSYDPSTKLATIGPGTSWDKVYPILEAQGVSVAGGRIVGVGTGGLTLGGGWGYKTQEHGLSSDTTVAYELVTYAGEILNVTESSNPDLFFGLQGGLNNFGIVTSFIMNTHPQTRVVAGLIIVPPENIPEYKKAMVKFSATNTDPKAYLNPLFTYFDGKLSGFAFLYYNGESLPNGTFSDFVALGASLQQQTLSGFIGTFPEPDNDTPTRWADHTAPIKGYPMELVDFIGNETEYWGQLLTAHHSATNVTCTLEMFLPTSFTNSRNAAYPHSVAQYTNPLNTGVLYLDGSEDVFANNAIKEFANRIQDQAIKLGLSNANDILYPNYAVADTPVHLMYGDNVARLAKIAKKNDPYGLLELTGGFKFN